VSAAVVLSYDLALNVPHKKENVEWWQIAGQAQLPLSPTPASCLKKTPAARQESVPLGAIFASTCQLL
jgi:hypothetical protein